MGDIDLARSSIYRKHGLYRQQPIQSGYINKTNGMVTCQNGRLRMHRAYHGMQANGHSVCM